MYLEGEVYVSFILLLFLFWVFLYFVLRYLYCFEIFSLEERMMNNDGEFICVVLFNFCNNL